MPGRPILPETEVSALYQRPDLRRRRAVLRETLARFESLGRAHYRTLALSNVARWRTGSAPPTGAGMALRVLPGDWGAVTLDLTREWGETFAVLNMANAFVPGGGYVEGMVAQEENLYRRSDCHFSILDTDFAPGSRDRYHDDKVALVSGKHGRVYLDTQTPRVCLRGPEDRSRPDLGYPWLHDTEIFPFYELRAAAVDLRDGSPFDADEMARRIAAQLDTLIDAGVRHAVLSAFGCGAFRNPAHRVATLYREALAQRAQHFDCVAFAIFHAGYGPDNFTPFRDALVG